MKGFGCPSNGKVTSSLHQCSFLFKSGRFAVRIIESRRKEGAKTPRLAWTGGARTPARLFGIKKMSGNHKCTEIRGENEFTEINDKFISAYLPEVQKQRRV